MRRVVAALPCREPPLPAPLLLLLGTATTVASQIDRIPSGETADGK
eukprot:gene13817-46863_t